MRKGKPVAFSNALEKRYASVLVREVKAMQKDLRRTIQTYLTFSEQEGLQLSPFAIEESQKAAIQITNDSPFSIEDLFFCFFDHWKKKFITLANKHVSPVTEEAGAFASNQLARGLKKVGFVVNFTNSHKVNRILQDAYRENVDLITSIPSLLHEQVKGIIKKGVEQGNDLQFIANEIEQKGKVSQRRARFIARDQVQKTHSAVSMARSSEAGLEYGFWFHRSGSKKPRITHKRDMNGVRFKLSEGLYDPDPKVKRKVKPGELHGCTCTYKPDLSSFNPKIAADNAIIIRAQGKSKKRFNQPLYEMFRNVA